MAKKAKPAPKSAARKSTTRKSTTRKSRAPNGHDTLREVEQLLYRQAECLDGKRWQEFIELFTEDGTYWMPAATSRTGTNALTATAPARIPASSWTRWCGSSHPSAGACESR